MCVRVCACTCVRVLSCACLSACACMHLRLSVYACVHVNMCEGHVRMHVHVQKGTSRVAAAESAARV